MQPILETRLQSLGCLCSPNWISKGEGWGVIFDPTICLLEEILVMNFDFGFGSVQILGRVTRWYFGWVCQIQTKKEANTNNHDNELSRLVWKESPTGIGARDATAPKPTLSCRPKNPVRGNLSSSNTAMTLKQAATINHYCQSLRERTSLKEANLERGESQFLGRIPIFSPFLWRNLPQCLSVLE